MTKVVFGLAIAVATLFSACKKEETPAPTPVKAKPLGSKSYVRITFMDKTLEARDTIVTDFLDYGTFYPMLNKFMTVANPRKPDLFDKTISFNTIGGGLIYNGDMHMVISATTYESPNNNAIDSFYTANNSPTAFYFEDYSGDEIKTYYINRQSVVYVDKNDDEYTEGRLKLVVKGSDGVEMPATGEYKIYKK